MIIQLVWHLVLYHKNNEIAMYFGQKNTFFKEKFIFLHVRTISFGGMLLAEVADRDSKR